MRGVTPATVPPSKILSEAGLANAAAKEFVYSQAIPETIEAYTRALTKIAGKEISRSPLNGIVQFVGFGKLEIAAAHLIQI